MVANIVGLTFADYGTERLIRQAVLHNPESLTGCFWDIREEDFDEDFLKIGAPPEEPKGEASWQVLIEYTDGTTQEIVSYQSCLADRPEELYLALLEYFEPEEDEFSEDFDEDAPL